MADSRPLKVLVASDKFKGSLSGPEACVAVADGLHEALGDSVATRLTPIADGGEGMALAITEALEGAWIVTQVPDPLGRPVRAGFGLVKGDHGERIGVIEMADASGLWRLAHDERDPWRASTRGTGELMVEAARRGVDRILLGIGGSATNDAGVGMAAALGFRFLDRAGAPVEVLPAELERVEEILPPEIPLPSVIVACDVTNPLLGPEGATRIYGPQKGVGESDFERHEARFSHLVSVLGIEGAAAVNQPGSGAAGGLGFGCLAFLGATLRPGFELIAEILGLEEAVQEADLVITGEGKLDGQTLQGKAPAGVAELARKHGKPVAALAGIVAEGAEEVLSERFDFFAPLESRGLSIEESMQRGGELLRKSARRHAKTIASLVS